MNASGHTLDCGFPFNSVTIPEWRRNFLTTKMSAALTLVTIFNLPVSPATILLNVLVMIAVKTRPPLRNKYNALLACLAGTDLMTGLLGQPLFIAEQIYRLANSPASEFCAIPYVARRFSGTFLTISLQLLAIISIERYLAIKYPLKYDDIITRRRLISVVILAWSHVLLTILHSLYKDITLVAFLRTITIFPSIFILIVCHIAVYYEARKQMQKIKTQQMSVEAKTAFLKEKKALKTTTLVVGLVLLSYIPKTLLTIAFRSLSINSPITYVIIESFFLTIALCNSVFNPLIYCARSSEYRRAFKKLLLRSNQVDPV